MSQKNDDADIFADINVNNKLLMNKKSNSQFYSKLLIYRSRQLSLAILCMLAIGAGTIMILNDLLAEKHWFAIAIPLFIGGSGFIFFPPTEVWEYKNWQNIPEKQEQYFYN